MLGLFHPMSLHIHADHSYGQSASYEAIARGIPLPQRVIGCVQLFARKKLRVENYTQEIAPCRPSAALRI